MRQISTLSVHAWATHRWLYDRAKNPSDSTLQQGLWLELIGGLLGDTDASEKAVTLLEKPSQTDSLTDSGACTSDVVADDNNDDDDDESDLGTMVRAALARAQCAVSMAKTKRTLHSLSAAKRESVTQHQVKVYRVADLSTDGFLSRHAIPRIPCIIRGACPDMQSPSGPLSTFASLRTCLTGKRGNLKRRVKGSASWASLEVRSGLVWVLFLPMVLVIISLLSQISAIIHFAGPACMFAWYSPC